MVSTSTENNKFRTVISDTSGEERQIM